MSTPFEPSGGKLTLRAVERTDLPTFYEQQRDPIAVRMAAFPPREYAEFMSHWQEILSGGEALTQTILWDGAIAGNVVCYLRSSDWLIGYWLGRVFWGKGIATQALQQFVAALKERPLFAYVLASNVGSVRVLEKCGFTPAPSDSDDDHELLYKLLK